MTLDGGGGEEDAHNDAISTAANHADSAQHLQRRRVSDVSLATSHASYIMAGAS